MTVLMVLMSDCVGLCFTLVSIPRLLKSPVFELTEAKIGIAPSRISRASRFVSSKN